TERRREITIRQSVRKPAPDGRAVHKVNRWKGRKKLLAKMRLSPQCGSRNKIEIGRRTLKLRPK
ncbi:hypothetical protein CDAR_310501, partial [Caerostris darwini]